MNASPPIVNGQLLPDGWKAIALRWLSRRYSGGTPDKNLSYYWNDGTIPWLNSGAVNQGVIRRPSDFITEEGFANSSAKWMPRGSVVMALAGQGKTKAMVGYLDIETTGNQSLAAIVPSAIEGKFLYWWLTSQYRHIRNLSSQDGRDGLNLEMLGSIRCPVPSLEAQERIAAFLDEKTAQIDGLIAKKQALLERLAEKRQAIITQAVTKGLNPATPMKDSGIDWLGEIPAHWEAKRLKYISPRVTVGIVVTPAAYYADEGTLALRGLNIKTMAFDLTDTRNISDDGHELNRKSELREGDLVAVRTGAPGTTAIVTKELAGCNCIDLVIIRRPANAHSRYLGWFLNSDIAKTQYGMGAEGALQQHFNVETSKEVIISLPPVNEQNEIAAYIDGAMATHDRQRTMVEESIAKLTEYRSALITAAVTGQIEGLK